MPLFAAPWTVWALVLVWGLHNFAFNAGNAVIQGFLADVLPAEQVGEALAQRGVVSTIAATQRTSPARALALAAAGLSLAPLFTRFAPTIHWVAITQLAVGAAVAGATLLLLQGSLSYAPAEQRSLYLAVHQTAMMAAAGLAPLFGGWLMDLVGPGNALVAGTCLRASPPCSGGGWGDAICPCPVSAPVVR